MTTTIRISRETKRMLEDIGKKGDTFDDIIRKATKVVYDWDKVHRTSVLFHTKEGIKYMDVIVPDVDNMFIDEDEFLDSISALCEENGIELVEYNQIYGVTESS